MSTNPILLITRRNKKSHGPQWAPLKIYFQLFLIFNFTFLLSHCGVDVEDSTPPSPPVWIQKSLPEEWPERGIDANETGGIFMEWEPNLGEDIIAYNIYRATWYDVNDSLGDYQLLKKQEMTSTAELFYVDEVAMNRTKYWYKIESQDVADNRSVFSDSVSYTLLPQINFSTMMPNSLTDTLDDLRQLSWSYAYLVEMENYCLSILTEKNDFVTRVTLPPGNYIERRESWRIPPEIELESEQVYMWRIDTGARYSDGHENAGSESKWATFVYVGE
jgi:hypothetical protein